MKILQWLWLLPFLCFLIGYYSVSWVFSSETIEVPQLSGKRLQDAVSLLVPYKLNLRILDEIEEPAVPEGTVISQRPAAGRKIKVSQSVGVVIAKKPNTVLAPNFVGALVEDVQAQAERKGLRVKTYFCNSSKYPINWCIAQAPKFNEELTDKTMVAFISSGDTQFRIMPDLYGKTLNEVYPFFNLYATLVSIFPQEYSRHTDCNRCRIVSQKPIAGSLVNLDTPLKIQLYVEHVE